MTGSELPIKKNKFPQLLHNWRWNMPGFHLQDETCWKGVGRWRKGSTAEVFMPVFTGNCVIAKQPNHVYPAQSFHTLNNRHFSPHQSTPDPCICYVNSIELEQESSCSVPPLFPPKRLHRTALLHNTESRFYLFILKKVWFLIIILHILRTMCKLCYINHKATNAWIIFPQSPTCRWQLAQWGFVIFMWLKIKQLSHVTGAPSELNERLRQTGLSAFHRPLRTNYLSSVHECWTKITSLEHELWKTDLEFASWYCDVIYSDIHKFLYCGLCDLWWVN